LEQWQWTIIANWGGMVILRLIDIVLRTKNNNDNNKIKTSRFIYVGKPIFKGEIKNRQEKYDRSKDKVIFKSRFLPDSNGLQLSSRLAKPGII